MLDRDLPNQLDLRKTAQVKCGKWRQNVPSSPQAKAAMTGSSRERPYLPSCEFHHKISNHMASGHAVHRASRSFTSGSVWHPWGPPHEVSMKVPMESLSPLRSGERAHRRDLPGQTAGLILHLATVKPCRKT